MLIARQGDQANGVDSRRPRGEEEGGGGEKQRGRRGGGERRGGGGGERQIEVDHAVGGGEGREERGEGGDACVGGRMDRTVMRAAERNGELIAHFAAERPRLQVAKMMRVGLLAAAHQTPLLANIVKMVSVAIAPRCRNGEHALVDAVGLIALAVCFREGLMGANIRMICWTSVGGGLCGCGCCELQ